MTIKIYEELLQGSEEWHKLRCGLLTASIMHQLVTPTLKIASGDKVKSIVYELVAQRINNYVEPTYTSEAMARGHVDEITCGQLYSENFCESLDFQQVGFITNDKLGFTIGCSPDGLVADDGMVEFKSRAQKYQMETILSNKIPDEHLIQCQTALLVTERKWLDYGSFCAGMPFVIIRTEPDPLVQEAILEAATKFEKQAAEMMQIYQERMADAGLRKIETQRSEVEMMI